MTLFEPRLAALLRTAADGRLELCAPAVGLWRDPPPTGAAITPGAPLGELEILGVRHRIDTPAGGHGTVVRVLADRARQPVAYGDVLVILDPSHRAAVASTTDPAELASSAGTLVVRSPSSGRIYLSPAPGKPPFVSPGDRLTAGTTLCLLEVMKTFNRVHYDATTLPDPATLTAILRHNEEDVDFGTPLFEVTGTEST